jgi:FG-GAP-like repeat
MPNNLQGQFDLLTATEGTPVAGNDIASFTDSTPGDTASNFTVTIDWGDNVTTTGTVVGSNGSFTVQGAHTYADDGLYLPVATITRTTDNTQLVLQSFGVTVGFAGNDVISGQGRPTIASASTVLTNVVVATFTDPFLAPASDYQTNIDWGDGNNTPGTLTLGNDNVYTVTGSHTYATGGDFTITAFMTDGGADNAPFASAQTQANLGFGGTEVFGAATETIAVPAGTTVATFADNTQSAPASNYTASIDWGDGTTTTGVVSGATGGPFTVTSAVAHTYADEGNFTEVVTITGTPNPITLSGSVLVFDTDSLSASGTTVTGSPNVALSNVTVATFSDSNTATPAGEFSANIDWGDGSTSTGTVSGSGGSFSVTGSHTYTQNGQDVITVNILGDQDSVAATPTSTALIGLAPVVGSVINTTEGTAIAGGTQVATFSDSNLGDTASSFTASIDWGDGVTTSGTVSGSSGSFTVTGGPHTYAEEGSDLVTTTLTRTTDNTTATAVGAVGVDEADVLSLTATSISGNAGQPFNNVQVATFTSTYTGSLAADFLATIDWGDGTTNDGTVTGSGGSFTVLGSHTYTSGGHDTLNVSVADESPGTATASGTATATINLGGQVVLTSATESTALANSTPVATFSDNNLTDTAGSFTASIDWGDGVTTSGSVVGAAGSFTVEGGHTYADEGSEIATVTLTRTADQSSAAVQGAVAVAEADNLTAHGTNLSVGANQDFNGTVATFTDAYTGNTADDFTATIDWDDGTTTTGTVTGSNGSFTVSGEHTYTSAGTDFAKITLTDDDPGTAKATATTTVTINALAGQMVLNSATEGTALPNTTTVATFTDSNLSDTAGGFTASINWGDGVTTTGTVVGSSGSFTVEGGHTYADEGSDAASVTLTRTSDNLQATTSGTIAVAEGDVLTGQGINNIKIKANQAFTGTVATFSDTDTANVSGDFAATIDWGDGTTTNGTVSGGSGTFAVSGTHTYTHPGHENLTVTLSDDAPGTATATAQSTANVSGPPKNDFNGDGKSDLLLQNNPNSAHPDVMVDLLNGSSIASSATITTPKGWHVAAAGDFNNDQKSDIVLQNTNGTPQIWLMNGTSVTSKVTLLNPGSSWHLVAAADFYNDGNTDLLFQNTDGTASIWQMNGTSIVGGGVVSPSPGSSGWTVIGAGDFNDDGNADILWQNTDGTVGVWEMNGNTVIGAGVVPTNPGSQWHAIGTGDFNGDGNADILFQNNDGTPMIWEMNGTSIVASATLPNPGAPWTAVGTNDFNGDGMADILFQRSDGTPMVWEMNGTSVVASFTLPNAGPQWKLQDDGPLPTAPGSSSSPAPALVHSSPDAATPAPVLSSPDTTQFAPVLSPPSTTANNSVAGVWMWADADGGMSLLPGPMPGGIFVPTR